MAELTTNRKTLLSDQETILARDIAPPKSIAEHENPEIQEIVFWDERNPKSLVNMVSDVVREELRKLPPSLLDAGIKASKKIPWEVDQIRLAFWDEYFIY